jgi:hypothetical protein
MLTTTENVVYTACCAQPELVICFATRRPVYLAESVHIEETRQGSGVVLPVSIGGGQKVMQPHHPKTERAVSRYS